MSADNVVYVQEKNGYYYWWEQSASVEPKIPDNGECFPDRSSALCYAHDLANKMEVLEYGVVELGEI